VSSTELQHRRHPLPTTNRLSFTELKHLYHPFPRRPSSIQLSSTELQHRRHLAFPETTSQGCLPPSCTIAAIFSRGATAQPARCLPPSAATSPPSFPDDHTPSIGCCLRLEFGQLLLLFFEASWGGGGGGGGVIA
jgi:hypothetical protein